MSKSCPECGSAFTGHPNKKFCSVECRSAAYAETARANTAKWRKADVERARNLDYSKHLKRKYGISVEEYERRLSEQNGRCKICNRTPEEVQDKTAWRLAVDHCHTTGKVRGLLCRPCNTAIGQLQESADIIQKALEYVKEHKN